MDENIPIAKGEKSLGQIYEETKRYDVKVPEPLLIGDPEIDEFLRDCLETMRSKGHDYRQGNDADILHNFRTVGSAVDVDMERVWFTYFYKHYSALVTFIKEGGQKESEPISGRIKDMIVYLLLFFKMVMERKKEAWQRVREISEKAEKSTHDFQRLKKLHEKNVTAVMQGEIQDTGPVTLDD
jgi:hypothetical protein